MWNNNTLKCVCVVGTEVNIIFWILYVWQFDERTTYFIRIGVGITYNTHTKQM